MCPRGRPRGQGRPRGLHLWIEQFCFSDLFSNATLQYHNGLHQQRSSSDLIRFCKRSIQQAIQTRETKAGLLWSCSGSTSQRKYCTKMNFVDYNCQPKRNNKNRPNHQAKSNGEALKALP